MDNIFNKSFEELMAQAGVAVTPVSEEVKAEPVAQAPVEEKPKEEPKAMQTSDFVVDVFGGDDTPMEDFNAFSEPVPEVFTQEPKAEVKEEPKVKVKEETKSEVKEEPNAEVKETKTKATKKTTKKATKKASEPAPSMESTDHILDDETKEHIREQIKVVVQQIVFEEVRSAVVLAMDTLVKDLRG